MIATLGRLDELRDRGQLDALLQSGAKFSKAVLLVAAHRQGGVPVIRTRRMGPAHGPGDSVHAVCPYDQYENPLRARYYDLFGTPGGQLVPGADCRGATRDVAGAVAGWWFPEGSTAGVDGSFAIGDTLDGEVRMGGPSWSLSVPR